MAENKRYYWMRLQEDFFSSKRIKKLRKLAGGDTFTIIYLKMQLLSITNCGVIVYTGLEDDFAEEIALDIDEDVENVRVTVQYLLSCGLLETTDNIEYVLPYAQQNIGSETASTIRSRKSRENKALGLENRQKVLQCNADATPLQQSCNVEKEIEKEIEIEKDIRGKSKRFIPPSIEQVKEYSSEKGYQIDAERFVDYYESKGWMIGKNKMKDWKAAVRNWQKNESTWEKAKKGSKPKNFTQREQDFNSLERMLLTTEVH